MVSLRTEVAAYVFVAALSYLLGLAALVHSFRRATDATERNQVKWILFGSMTALVPIGYTLYLIYWEQEAFGAGTGNLADVCSIRMSDSCLRH